MEVPFSTRSPKKRPGPQAEKTALSAGASDAISLSGKGLSRPETGCRKPLARRVR